MKTYILIASALISVLIAVILLDYFGPKEREIRISKKWYQNHMKVTASKAIECKEQMKGPEAKKMDIKKRRECLYVYEICDESFGVCEKYGYK